MMERFSDRARHAMALANREAANFNHDYLSPAHLMLGLIAEGACVATEALRLLNVNLEKVRDEVRNQMSQGTNGGQLGRRAHTQELKDTIAKAIDEARKFGHRYIGTEHLILGMLATAGSLPSKVLAGQGINVETVREKTLSLLKSSIDASHDLAHSRHGDFEWVHQQELSKAFRSSKFWHLMILAVDNANRMGEGEIQPEHLLLALLRDADSRAAKLLAEKGVTQDWVRERLMIVPAGRA